VHLVGFTTEIHHDARPHQICQGTFYTADSWWW